MAVQQALATHMGALGIVPDRRRLTPHLTVAFRDLRPAAFRLAWQEFQHRPYRAEFTAKELVLLHHDGQCWQVETT